MPPPGRKYKTEPKVGPNMSNWTEAEKAAYYRKQRLETPVAEMKLAVRVINTLEDHNVVLAKQLLHQTYETLMAMTNFGERTLDEVADALRAIGLEPPVWKKPPRRKKPTKATGPFDDLYS